jgi:hypothetical protein
MGVVDPPRPLDADALQASDVRTAAAALLERPVAEVSFRAEAVDPQLRIHSVTGGVLRVWGSADGADFSLVVKATQQGVDADPDALWVSGADPRHRNYWKREWLAYTSHLLADLPGRLRAPRLLHATEPARGVAWLWLEDVRGLPGPEWEHCDYAKGAYDLGTTQGDFAAGSTPLPEQPWLSRGWLDEWLRTTTRWWPLVDDDAAWRDPRLAPLAGLRSRARSVWDQRDRLRAIVASAPRTLVHLDFWPTNVIAGDDGRTVAIDWSSVGIGGLSQDLDQLTLDPVWMQVLPGADLGELERAVLPAYSSGVRAGGAAATDAELRRWYAATAGLRYCSVLATQADIAADTARVAGIEARWQRPFEEVAADRARVVAQALDLAEQALAGT